MDDQRFDRFVKLIGSGASRRRVLKTFMGGALAGVAASTGLASETGAASRKRSVGNSCTVNADCASNLCVTERRGRKICHCGGEGDCPISTDQCRPVSCQANGMCAVAPVTCTASDQCHDVGMCDPGTGECSDPMKAG